MGIRGDGDLSEYSAGQSHWGLAGRFGRRRAAFEHAAKEYIETNSITPIEPRRGSTSELSSATGASRALVAHPNDRNILELRNVSWHTLNILRLGNTLWPLR